MVLWSAESMAKYAEAGSDGSDKQTWGSKANKPAATDALCDEWNTPASNIKGHSQVLDIYEKDLWT